MPHSPAGFKREFQEKENTETRGQHKRLGRRANRPGSMYHRSPVIIQYGSACRARRHFAAKSTVICRLIYQHSAAHTTYLASNHRLTPAGRSACTVRKHHLHRRIKGHAPMLLARRAAPVGIISFQAIRIKLVYFAYGSAGRLAPPCGRGATLSPCDSRGYSPSRA